MSITGSAFHNPHVDGEEGRRCRYLIYTVNSWRWNENFVRRECSRAESHDNDRERSERDNCNLISDTQNGKQRVALVGVSTCLFFPMFRNWIVCKMLVTISTRHWISKEHASSVRWLFCLLLSVVQVQQNKALPWGIRVNVHLRYELVTLLTWNKRHFISELKRRSIAVWCILESVARMDFCCVSSERIWSPNKQSNDQ